MEKKKLDQVKWVILVVLYCLVLPITLIGFKLFPYIIANDTTIDLKSFVITILKHPFQTFLEICQSNYLLAFLIVQLIVFIVLYVFLHPTKRQPFEVVGKTNPVHGSAYWGEESEINVPKDVHLIPEKTMKSILEKSMRRGKNE